MVMLHTHFVILFTVQVLLVLYQAPIVPFLLLWGSLFLLIIIFRRNIHLQADHPHHPFRRQLTMYSLLLLILLLCTQLFLTTTIQHQHDIVQSSELHQYVDSTFINVQGRVTTPVFTDGNYVRFDLRVTKVNHQPLSSSPLVRITAYTKTLGERQRFQDVRRHDQWKGRLQLSDPTPARNPGGFDYKKYLHQNGINFLGEADHHWEHEPNDQPFAQVLKHMDQFRANWSKRTNQLFSAEVAPVVQAMTIGDRTDLANDMLKMYRELGIVHVLAISGLHVGILLLGAYRLLILLPLTRETVTLLLLLFIPFYIYVSGAQPSVIRAGSMAGLVLILHWFHLWRHSLHALYLVYILTLLYNPYWIFHVGYQLSFFITFILIVGYPHMDKWMQRWAFPAWLRSLLGISLLAQIAALPILIYHFYQFSPVSLITNIFVVPLYSLLFIPCAFIITLGGFISTDLMSLSVTVYEWIFSRTQYLIQYIYDLPYAVINIGRPHVGWFILYFVIFMMWFISLELQKWLRSIFFMSLLGVLMMIQAVHPYFDSKAYITILDVGQGDAIVIELPYRKEVILMDLGGNFLFSQEEWKKREDSFEIGKDIVLPYLQYRGVQSIDRLIYTHGHFDHFGGVQGILGEINIEAVFRPPVAPNSTFEKTWLEKIGQQGIPIYSLKQGDQWGTDEAFFHVLFPAHHQEEWVDEWEHLHDYNMVIWNRIYEHSFIWTGDVEEEGERQILHLYPQLKTDILKVAHHGSHTSSTEKFLDQTEPSLAVISVGRNNRYGHPHQEVIERYKQREIPVFRTDWHGGVQMIIESDHLKARPTLQYNGDSLQ